MSVLRARRKKKKTGRVGGWGGDQILLTAASVAIHEKLGPMRIHPRKRGQTSEENSIHPSINCRVLAVGMQTHGNDTVGLRQNKDANMGNTEQTKECLKLLIHIHFFEQKCL